MQRQSLGSPSSKLQIHGGKDEKSGEDENHNGGAEAEENKAEKPIRSRSRTEKTIHLIPILTLLCFVILYLCSHDPSPKDLVSIGGIGRLYDAKAVSGAEIGRYFAAERGGISAIRSHRGLKVVEKLRHRKLGIL